MGVVITRLGLGSGIVALVAGLFWVDLRLVPYLPLAFLLAALALGAQAELYRMLKSAGMLVAPRLGLLAGAYYLATRIAPGVEWSFTHATPLPQPQASFDAGAHLAVAVVLALVVGVLRRRVEGFPQRMGTTLVGLLVVPFLLGYTIEIRYLPEGWAWVVFLVAVAKVGDSAAFFLGRAFGRRKLIPEVSPGKSWEGAAGSLGGSLLAGWLVGRLAFSQPLPWDLWLVASLAVNLGAQFGDLGESLLKRGCGTKDSARLLPAFGGVFDLVDSFLIAGPVLRLLLAVWPGSLA